VSAEESKAIVRRWFEDLFNEGNLDVADEIVAPNHVAHDPALPDILSGPEGQKRVVSLYRGAFPDAHITVEHQIAEGNEVVTRWTGTALIRANLWAPPRVATGWRCRGSPLTAYPEAR
jgi:predicted SnoaL-like aldol condensation-catalyzing enzyme